ncbi:MAG: T9SS type A sorting domain-containing protein, partial [Candidatus Tenebribacter burtonii]|nr:T9SS type A sorting domain-containing protein [Candidatus Tenebribacter burtonii]
VFVSVSSIIIRQDEIVSTLYKIDVSNPYEPAIVDSISFPENIKHDILRTYGEYLAYHKLEDIDNEWVITQLVFIDPVTFEEILSFPINSWTCSLMENYFLHRRNYTDLIFDVYDYTDINNIQMVGSVNFATCPTDFMKIYAINDDNLVLLGNESISIYDISDLTDIHIVSTYYRYNNASPFGDCLQIDNFLLIPSQSAGIEVVDITDIENPLLYDFWEYPIDELSIVDPFFMTLAGIIYDDGHLYVGTYHHGILLMDFNDGTIEYVDNFINNRTNKEFKIYNNNYLITSGFSKGLYVYDIENVNSPEFLTILLDDLDVFAFEIINEYIYIIHLNLELGYYFCVYDISDLSNPILRWNELLNASPLFIINENEPDNIYVRSNVNSFQSVEIRKYNITDPENIEQILLYEYPEIMLRPPFFFEGYLYAVGLYENGGANLFIFDGFEDENPEMVNQITNFVDGSNIQMINSYLNTSSSSYFVSDSFYNLDDPINPELAFTIQNTSTCFKNYYIDNVLFSPGRYTVFLYDLENDPTGELEPFDYFNLNSKYSGISFFSQGEENYFFCEQRECISTYNYSIETSVEDELPKPDITLSNYPNPFNPETNIVFNLPEDGEVQLDIYNIKGQKVDQLEITNYELGINEVTWDAEGFASGIYLYQLKVDSKAIASRKCLLLK